MRENKFISIIVPFKDKLRLLKKCIHSIFTKTEFKNFELVLVNNNSDSKSLYSFLKQLSLNRQNVKVINYEKPFNFSAINNYAIPYCKGDTLLFLNNDTEVISKGWLKSLLDVSKKHQSGVVGARLLYEDYTIQHDGIVFNNNGRPLHIAKHNIENSEVCYSSKTRKISAVTGACMLIQKKVFLEVGGFDEHSFPISYNDVDLSLKLLTKGYHNYICSSVKLFHYESKSRPRDNTEKAIKRLDKELQILKNRYSSFFSKKDPHLRGKGLKLLSYTAGLSQNLSKFISTVQNFCQNNNINSLILYGAGLHTERLLKELPKTIKKRVQLIIDDSPKKSQILKVPIKTPTEIVKRSFDMLLISSDTIEEKLFNKALLLKLDCKTIFAPYSQRLITQ